MSQQVQGVAWALQAAPVSLTEHRQRGRACPERRASTTRAVEPAGTSNTSSLTSPTAPALHHLCKNTPNDPRCNVAQAISALLTAGHSSGSRGHCGHGHTAQNAGAA